MNRSIHVTEGESIGAIRGQRDQPPEVDALVKATALDSGDWNVARRAQRPANRSSTVASPDW
jgi:hypothetical protein